MDIIAVAMKSICEEIAESHGDRKRSIKALREQAEAVRENAWNFLANCRKVQKEMAAGLIKGLEEQREELQKNVSSLREDFRKKEKDIRADLAEASKIWNKTNETLRAKKKGEKNDR